MAPTLIKTEFDGHTRSGDLVEKLETGRLRCTACAHLCELADGQRGVCKVRFHEDGDLRVPFNYAAGVHNDPIEKKPFFHALPGTRALSFGMLGCDFKCSYCQNWFTSQTLRDASATVRFSETTPEQLSVLALREGARTLVSTYNEPLITSEWAVAVFKEARRHGLNTAYVSNGHGTPQVIDYIAPWIDFYKVDLKCFNDRNYRKLGGSLKEVLETIQRIHARGLWLEIVTLVIPHHNDSDAELQDIAGFLADVSCDIPWHVTAFRPEYKMNDRGATPVETLLRAHEIGRKAGLNFVYCGNLAGRVMGLENTVCPGCGAVLIERVGFRMARNRLADGQCPDCRSEIPGRWS